MNVTENCDKIVLAINRGRAGNALKIVASGARWIWRGCSAALFLGAVPLLLIEAGAPANLRPSTSLEPFLKQRPKVLLRKIDRLILGGLPYAPVNALWGKIAAAICVVGLLRLGVSGLVIETPEVVIVGVSLFAAGYFGGIFYREPLALKNVNTFRDLTEIIVKREQRHDFHHEANPICILPTTQPSP